MRAIFGLASSLSTVSLVPLVSLVSLVPLAAADPLHTDPEPRPWVSDSAAAALAQRAASCPQLNDVVAPQGDGEQLRAREVQVSWRTVAIDLERYSAGSGREATASSTLLRLPQGRCSAVGFSQQGGKESLLSWVQGVAVVATVKPTLAEVAELAEAWLVTDPDRDEVAPARLLVQLSQSSAADASAAAGTGAPSSGLFEAAAPVQPLHRGKPHGSPATLWSPQALAAAAVPGPIDEDDDGAPYDAVLALAVRAPVLRAASGRWQLWETRFRARLGGGLLAVYDRRGDQHRWVLASELDNGGSTLSAKGKHFDIFYLRGELALVRQRFDDQESLWAIHLATGVARQLTASGPFRIVGNAVEVTGADGARQRIAIKDLAP
jgi:hypothetical protein